MITLGIETSCDETAICLLKDGKVLSDVVASSVDLHSKYGGVVPEMASRHHLEVILQCLDSCLKKAKIKASQIDLISSTGGPGLMGSLLVGISCAKTLSLTLNKPLVFVDHVIAHAFAPIWDLKKKFPFVSLVVSGGHTLIIYCKNFNSIKILGETSDDAAGEAFDKVAKMLDLGYPGGPQIEKIAVKGSSSKYAFPRPWMKEPHFNFSFSGLKTAVFYQLKKITDNGKLTSKIKSDIASSFQEAACEVLVNKTLKASELKKVSRIVVGGGVSANSRLRQMFEEKAKKYQKEVVFPSKNLSVDNAVMIAAFGEAKYKEKPTSFKSSSGKERSLKFKAYSDFFMKSSR